MPASLVKRDALRRASRNMSAHSLMSCTSIWLRPLALARMLFAEVSYRSTFRFRADRINEVTPKPSLEPKAEEMKKMNGDAKVQMGNNENSPRRRQQLQ